MGVDFNENTLHAGVKFFSNKNEINKREKPKEV